HHRLDDGPHPLEVHQGEMATALPHRDPVLHRDRLPVRRVDRERARLRDHMTLARPDSRKADSMTDSHSTKKTIVFAGGGHAHLYSLRRTGELVDAGYEVVLINPSRFLYYSGMAPGLLSRIYRPEEDRIDVRYLVKKGGGRFVQAW